MAAVRPDGDVNALSFNAALFLTSLAVEDFSQTVRLTAADALANHPVMNDLSQDAWFYAQNGEKGGPVGFSELLGMAKDGKLNPRLDLVWAKGMERWQPAGEINGLFDVPIEVEVPALAVAVAPIRPATVVTPAVTNAVDPYGSSGGNGYGQADVKVAMPGARRAVYLFFLMVFPVLWFVLFGVLETVMSGKLDPGTLNMIVSGVCVVPGLVGLVICVMRLVNLGMSGWWLLGNFVPFLNLWIGYRCFACPAGYAIHKKMDRTGIILAILYWLLLLAGIVAFAALVALVFGHMGPPDLREQIVDAIRKAANLPPNP